MELEKAKEKKKAALENKQSPKGTLDLEAVRRMEVNEKGNVETMQKARTWTRHRKRRLVNVVEGKRRGCQC